MGIGNEGDPMFTLLAGAVHGVAHTLRGEGFDASEDGTGRGIPLVAARMTAFGEYEVDGTASTVKARDYKDATDLIAFHASQDPISGPMVPALGAKATMGVLDKLAVRRLTPRECERLQGFPDDYTLIPYGGISKSKLQEDYIKYLMRGGTKTREECYRLAADGPRYKAMGNSMCRKVMEWLGRRIQAVEEQMQCQR